MTFSTGNGPRLLKIDTFHIAARANMTDEVPVATLKSSISLFVFTRSRDPPLQNLQVKKLFSFVAPLAAKSYLKPKKYFDRDISAIGGFSDMAKSVITKVINSVWLQSYFSVTQLHDTF